MTTRSQRQPNGQPMPRNIQMMPDRKGFDVVAAFRKPLVEGIGWDRLINHTLKMSAETLNSLLKSDIHLKHPVSFCTCFPCRKVDCCHYLSRCQLLSLSTSYFMFSTSWAGQHTVFSPLEIFSMIFVVNRTYFWDLTRA
jgi:hypothetical protein